jgi:hypothetical protein
MRGWKEWYDEQEDGVWELSPEEEEAVRAFNEETPLTNDDKEERKGWSKDELPF